jgi:cytochrome c biogenesis protein CcdA
MLGENLTLGVIIIAALIDSINPCVFGVLIFLIAFMNRLFASRNMMLLGGLIYTAVVYITYLVLGFGILRLTLSIGVASFFYFIVALIAIIAGLLEIKDYFWYGRWFSLEIIPGGAARIKYYTAKIEALKERHPSALMGMMALLGVFVVLVELPCTGAPYFAILGLLAQGNYAAATPLLLLYNFIFVVPLLVVIGVSYFGATSDRLEVWRKEHRGLMRLIVGLFLVALGAYMLYTLPPFF